MVSIKPPKGMCQLPKITERDDSDLISDPQDYKDSHHRRDSLYRMVEATEPSLAPSLAWYFVLRFYHQHTWIAAAREPSLSPARSCGPVVSHHHYRKFTSRRIRITAVERVSLRRYRQRCCSTCQMPVGNSGRIYRDVKKNTEEYTATNRALVLKCGYMLLQT